MNEFSEELRRAREAKQMSLDAISATTKVSRRNLEALESGDLAALPGGVFRKGIVRAYVVTLGLEPEPWMDRFEGYLAASGETGVVPISMEQIAEGVERSRGLRAAGPMRWPGVMAMLAILLVFGWCIWHFALRGHLLVSWRGVPRVTVVARPFASS